MNFSMLGLLALVSGAIASDDQSLMQHGLGSATGRAEVQESLNIIKQAIDEIPNPGKVRQMAIDALMKSVSDADQIDDSVVQALADVIGLLDSILGNFNAFRNTDQAALLAAAATITSSNDDGWASDRTKNTTFGDLKSSHNTCRVRQAGDNTIEDEKCNPLEQLMTEFQGHSHSTSGSLSGYCHVEEIGTYDNSCTDHPANSIAFLECKNTIRTQLLATWSTFITDGKTEWEDRETTFTETHQVCQEAMQNASDEETACNLIQNSLDIAFCTWMYHREHICSTNSQNWDDRVAAYDTLWGQKSSDAEARKNTAAMIEYIKCLCRKLKDTGSANLDPVTGHAATCKTDTSTDDFINSLQADYGVEHEDYDDKAACDETFFDDHPSADTAQTTRYQNTHYELDVVMDLAPSGTMCNQDDHHTG